MLCQQLVKSSWQSVVSHNRYSVCSCCNSGRLPAGFDKLLAKHQTVLPLLGTLLKGQIVRKFFLPTLKLHTGTSKSIT